MCSKDVSQFALRIWSCPYEENTCSKGESIKNVIELSTSGKSENLRPNNQLDSNQICYY